MQKTATAWDDEDFVRTWNETYGHDMRNAPIRGAFVFPWIASHAGNMQGKCLIDIGCGNGNLINHFQKSALNRLVGVDPGSAVIASAKLSVTDPRATFIHASATQPLPVIPTGNMFDFATSVFVVEEIPSNQFQAYCSTIRESLKEKGTAFIFTNHPANAMVVDITANIKGEPNTKFANHSGYFDRTPNAYTLEIMNNKQGFAKKAEYHHKTISDILNAFATAGMSLRAMIEVPQRVITLEAAQAHIPKSGDTPRFAGFVFQKN